MLVLAVPVFALLKHAEAAPAGWYPDGRQVNVQQPWQPFNKFIRKYSPGRKNSVLCWWNISGMGHQFRFSFTIFVD